MLGITGRNGRQFSDPVTSSMYQFSSQWVNGRIAYYGMKDNGFYHRRYQLVRHILKWCGSTQWQPSQIIFKQCDLDLDYKYGYICEEAKQRKILKPLPVLKNITKEVKNLKNLGSSDVVYREVNNPSKQNGGNLKVNYFQTSTHYHQSNLIVCEEGHLSKDFVSCQSQSPCGTKTAEEVCRIVHNGCITNENGTVCRERKKPKMSNTYKQNNLHTTETIVLPTKNVTLQPANQEGKSKPEEREGQILPVLSEIPMFRCSVLQDIFIHYTYVCDFLPHCPLQSDEIFCIHSPCNTEEV